MTQDNDAWVFSEENDMPLLTKFVYNPYYINMRSDGSVCEIHDCMSNLLPIEFMRGILEYSKKYLEDFASNDMVVSENAKRQGVLSKERITRSYETDIERLENPVKVEIYLIKDTIRGVYKIGKAICSQKRLKQLKTANAGIEMFRFFDGVSEDERILHKHFIQQGKRIDGEWFSLGTSDFEYIESYFTAKNA